MYGFPRISPSLSLGKKDKFVKRIFGPISALDTSVIFDFLLYSLQILTLNTVPKAQVLFLFVI